MDEDAVEYYEGHPRAGMIDYYKEDVLIRTEFRIGHPKHGVIIYHQHKAVQLTHRPVPPTQLKNNAPRS